MASSKKRERVFALVKEIERLEAELAARREELVARNRELDHLIDARLAKVDEEQEAEADRAEVSPAEVATYQQRIETVLLNAGHVPQTAQAVAVAIGHPSSLQTVRAILSRLLKSGAAERPSPNQYRMKRRGHATLDPESD